MTAIDSIKQLKDEQLSEFIAAAQTELAERAEQRKQNAMEEIRRIAAGAKIDVSFGGTRSSRRTKVVLKFGDRYVHPTDATKAFVVGKGRPPAWFVALQKTGRLPQPEPVTK